MKIIFFGDSITVGQYIPPHQTWSSRLSKQITEFGLNCEKEILVQIEAINGRTTRQALEDIPVEVQKHSPQMVMVQFGMNDCNHWLTDQGLPRVSEAGFRANLLEIIDRCFNFGAKHIFLNTNHPSARSLPLDARPAITYQQSNQRYNEIIRDVAHNFSAEQLTLIDMETVFLTNMDSKGKTAADFVLPEPDLLHLNQDGHDLYFETISPVVLHQIKQLNESA